MGATTAKALSPLVLRLDGGISSKPLFEDLRALTFGFACNNSEMYGGARSCKAL